MKTLFQAFAIAGLLVTWAGASSTPGPQGPADVAPPAICGAEGVCARPPEYFPLEVGNIWLYRGSGTYAGTTLTLEITKAAEFNGKRYFLLSGFPGKEYWLRKDANGSVVAYEPIAGVTPTSSDLKPGPRLTPFANSAAIPVDRLWWAFNWPIGKEYTTYLPGTCCQKAVINSRSLPYKGPIGTFDCALEILYPGVFQVGIEREVFLPNIGLAFRRAATGGPSSGAYELTYARVHGATAGAVSEFGFTLALDNSIYVVDMMPPFNPATAAPVARVRLTLGNSAQPVALTFPTGQLFDFEIRNEHGQIMYRWSDGKAFTQAVRTEVFGPGEKNFLIQVRLNGPDKQPLPQGRYVAEGWLTTMGKRVFVASLRFEVRWVW